MLVVGQHLRELVLAQQAVVHEDAVQLVADGLLQQHGGHGAVHPAAEGHDHLAVSHLLPQALHGAVHEAGRGPVGLGVADAQHEVAQQLQALGGVVHLRVELHGEGGFPDQLVGGHGHGVGAGEHLHGPGRGGDAVAVAHPDLGAGVDAGEERPGHVDVVQVRPAVLPHVAALHGGAGALGQQLGAVAHGQHGHAAFQPGQVGVRRVGVVHAEGASAQDHALHGGVVAVLGGLGEGVDLAVDVELAHAAGDELGVLRPVVEDQDHVGTKGSRGGGTGCGHGRRVHALPRSAAPLRTPPPCGRWMGGPAPACGKIVENPRGGFHPVPGRNAPRRGVI